MDALDILVEQIERETPGPAEPNVTETIAALQMQLQEIYDFVKKLESAAPPVVEETPEIEEETITEEEIEED